MNPDIPNSNPEGQQLCGVAKALIGDTVYFLSGRNDEYRRRPESFTLEPRHKVVNGYLYSPKMKLGIQPNENVKVFTIDGPVSSKQSYIVSEKGFIMIRMGNSVPAIADKGPIPFTPFPDGVTIQNFEEKLRASKDSFRNAFDAIHLPENPPSATERPTGWGASLSQCMAQFGIPVEHILIGNKVVVITGSGSRYECLIERGGLNVIGGKATLLGTLLTRFVSGRLVGAVSGATSAVTAIETIN